MAKKENCEQLQEEKSLEEMFAELDLLAEKLENRDTHRWRTLLYCTDRAWNF